MIEERITAIIEKFVFQPEYVGSARLIFAQKLNLARSMSLDRSGSSVWQLIEKLNVLRNKLAHSLNSAARSKATESLRASFIQECGGRLPYDAHDERVWLAGVLAMSLGFVHAFELEVERFKQYVAVMDRAVNRHRHNT